MLTNGFRVDNQRYVCLINISLAIALSLDGIKPDRRQGEKFGACSSS